MRKFKNSFFYVGTLVIFSLFMLLVFNQGDSLEEGRSLVMPESDKGIWHLFGESISHNLSHPLAILLAQIITIIFAARLFGWLCRRIGQPSVIGEIIAGIILGPSVIGMYLPEFSLTIFPAESLGNLQFLSQIGLILFMFVIGMELDLKVLRKRASDAVVVSHASIIIPFALGVGLAYFIYSSFAPESAHFLPFSLFLGIAMSVTAFPVLARIIQERGIHKTRLGTIVITCAATDDITAWCLLAVVIAIVKAGDFISSLFTVGTALSYVLLMIYVIRPFLKRVGDLHASKENLSKSIVAIFFLILIISSYITEIIGIHALFGAFMAGAVMPDNAKFRGLFIEKIEDVSLILLLPLFFVFTGLRTEIGLLNDVYMWKITGAIILVAIAGKFAGSAIAARFVGQSWKDSFTIGALMNSRGLMELVVLNIGYDLGVLGPEIFAMMVIMALVTTLMTGPSLDIIDRIFGKTKELSAAEDMPSKFRILVSFANPERGKTLLRLSNNLSAKMGDKASVTAMHLSPVRDLHHYNIDEYEKESFSPVIAESRRIGMKIDTIFKASSDIENDITDVVNEGDYDLLLVGIGQSIFEGSLFGKILGFTTRIINPDNIISQVTGKENIFENLSFDKRTTMILSRSNVPVGILIDKNLQEVSAVFIPLFEERDAYLIQYAQKLIRNSSVQVNFLDVTGISRKDGATGLAINALKNAEPGFVTIIESKQINRDFLKNMQLMLITTESWKELVDSKSIWLSDIPSTLILSDK